VAGARDDDARRAREALDEPHRDQRADGGREDAQEQGDRVGCNADQEGTATAQRVGEGAGDQLAQSKAEQAGAQGELHLRGADSEAATERGQGRQIHIDGERRKRAQGAQDEQQTDPACHPCRAVPIPDHGHVATR